MINAIEITSFVNLKVYWFPGFDKLLNQNEGNNLNTGIIIERKVFIIYNNSGIKTDRVKTFNEKSISSFCNTIN